MFKNLLAFRIAHDWQAPSLAALEDALQTRRFAPCAPKQEESIGWSHPRPVDHSPLVESIGGQWLFKLMLERKKVPAAVIKAEVEARCKAIEESEGRVVGRKERKGMKDDVYFDMLPRVFPKRGACLVWLDPVNRTLAVATASAKMADLAVSKLAEILAEVGTPLAAAHFKVVLTPESAMSQWLVTQEAPAGFTVDRDLELRLPDNEQSVVRYSRHALDILEIAEHIKSGKVPTQLALTWEDRMSFTLTDGLVIKKLHMLDEVFSGSDESAGFDGDVAIVTTELSRMLPDLLQALGGEVQEEHS